MQEITFINIEHQRLRKLFLETCRQYEFPDDVHLILRGTKLKGSTMQAQPIIQWRSWLMGIDTYQIKVAEFVRNSKKLEVTELSDDILIGWFAHELGHIVDYMHRSPMGMILYGIRYLLSAEFRKKIEHRADEIAIAQGFHDYILKTKAFLFHHEHIHETYRNKMKRYYMSIEDARALIPRDVPIDPVE